MDCGLPTGLGPATASGRQWGRAGRMGEGGAGAESETAGPTAQDGLRVPIPHSSLGLAQALPQVPTSHRIHHASG